MLELKLLPAQYIEKYGRDKVTEIIGRPLKAVAMWERTGAWPISAVQALLDFDPSPIHAIRPLYETIPETEKKICILMPLLSAPKKATWDTFVRLYDRATMDYRFSDYDNKTVARNQLAAWAFRGGYDEWIWMDGDGIVPVGDAEFFRGAAKMPNCPAVWAKMNTLKRLRVHRQRGVNATILSCCTVSRNGSATPQFGGGSAEAARVQVRKGPQDILKEVPWVPFHFTITHRSVFEDIIKTQGDEIRMDPNGIGKRFGYEYGFFDPISREFPTEDVPFCQRALRAGHKSWVDLGVQAIHIGDFNYSYLNA